MKRLTCDISRSAPPPGATKTPLPQKRSVLVSERLQSIRQSTGVPGRHPKRRSLRLKHGRRSQEVSGLDQAKLFGCFEAPKAQPGSLSIRIRLPDSSAHRARPRRGARGGIGPTMRRQRTGERPNARVLPTEPADSRPALL